ncbi:NUDIX domain-containing protein [Nocardia sp. NPDC058499]|uniref:NUDIX domain-containing protein n=1 Tax=Nocardia sp. NPDC058499 TaxID=3346530 RepID=UPI003648406F
MHRRGPWIRHSSDVVLERQYFTVVSDTVTTPGGTAGHYDWVAGADQVRVAALTGSGALFVVAQHHYVPDTRMWQLPGGNLDPGEEPAAGAARELAEEVGAHARHWRKVGALWALPGLATTKVHLFVATGLTMHEARPDDDEADLVTQVVGLEEAVTAALDGTIGCAASAALVLSLAPPGRDPGSTLRGDTSTQPGP